MIDIELAFRIRFLRGLVLPVDEKYDDPRLSILAGKYKEIEEKSRILDDELYSIYKEYLSSK